MKKIFAVIMIMFACLIVNAQEIYYSDAIAKKLTSVGFTVTKSGYASENLMAAMGADVPVYCVILSAKRYSVEQARLAIVKILKKYDDCRLETPWEKEKSSTSASYRCDGTPLIIWITYKNGKCNVLLLERAI